MAENQKKVQTVLNPETMTDKEFLVFLFFRQMEFRKKSKSILRTSENRKKSIEYA